MSSSKQLKLGVIISYLSIGINILSGLIYTPWMIHSIGKENFGLYTLSLSVISLFVFDFGLSTAVIRFISKYVSEGNQEKANKCYGLVYRLYLFLDVLLFLILLVVFFFIPQIYRELTIEEISKFKIVYVITSIYSILSFPFITINGVLVAHEKIIQLKLCEVAHKLLVVGAMSICLLLGFGLYALVCVNAVSGLIVVVLKLTCIKKYTKQRVEWNYFNKLEFKEIISYSSWVTIISLAQRCIFNIAPSILGALSGSSSIAILGIAITLEGYTYTFANAMNGVFLPKVSRIVYQGNGDVLPLMVKVARLQIIVIGFIVVGFICFGKEFIDLWVGNSFNESYVCAILLIIPSLIQLPQEIGLQTIHATNMVKPLAKVFIYMAFTSVILSFAMASDFGAKGIGVSVFVAYLLRTVGMDFILHKKMGINIFRFFKESFVSMMIPLCLSLVVGMLISHFKMFSGWIDFFLRGCCFSVSYCFIIYFIAMNNSERNIFINPIKKLLKIG